MENLTKNKRGSMAPTIIVCVLLVICATAAILLSGYDWHDDYIIGGNTNIGHSAEIGDAISKTSEPEDWDYFDDTVMVGDSITYGMASYGYLNFNHVFAKIGLHQGTALTSKCVYTSSTNGYSISDALEIAKPGKIYVTLGINAIYSYKADWFYDNYRALLNKIKTASPDSVIIIQSIFPVTQNWAINNGKPNCNQYIAYANQKLSELAKEENCYFLHTYEDLTDEYGFLKPEFSGDGIHLSRKGYETVFNYILTHPVKSSGKFTSIGAIRPPSPQVSANSQVSMPELEEMTSLPSLNTQSSLSGNENTVTSSEPDYSDESSYETSSEYNTSSSDVQVDVPSETSSEASSFPSIPDLNTPSQSENATSSRYSGRWPNNNSSSRRPW